MSTASRKAVLNRIGDVTVLSSIGVLCVGLRSEKYLNSLFHWRSLCFSDGVILSYAFSIVGISSSSKKYSNAILGGMALLNANSNSRRNAISSSISTRL